MTMRQKRIGNHLRELDDANTLEKEPDRLQSNPSFSRHALITLEWSDKHDATD